MFRMALAVVTLLNTFFAASTNTALLPTFDSILVQTYRVSEQQVQEVFATVGSVESIKIMAVRLYWTHT